MVSKVETTWYIQVSLIYGLRKLFWEAIHAKFENLNNYMALMLEARKAQGLAWARKA